MSRFLKQAYSTLEPYTPGEQPKDMQYIKLNTNESPFPPSPSVVAAAAEEASRLNLYSDPECSILISKLAEYYDTDADRVIVTNGSDEVINFAFMAFCDKQNPVVFPDITYGFYPVFANLNGVPYDEMPLSDDYTVNADDYIGIGRNIVIANPNAPTGISIPLEKIEQIVKSNPSNVVLIDEAYVDFGGESAIPLTKKYDNLIVVGTFSKSRSLAGARLGFAISSREIIRDLNTVRYSTNPYNVNRMTMLAGYRALCDDAYYKANAETVVRNREYTRDKLCDLGFRVLPSNANFLFAESSVISGEQLYLKLKERGILVRHFSKPRISNFNRITVGTREQMDALLSAIEEVLSEDVK